MSAIFAPVAAATFGANVQTVSGVKSRREVGCIQNCFASSSFPGGSATTSSNPTPRPTPQLETLAAVALFSSPAATTPKETNARSSVGTKIAIGIGAGVLLLLLACVALEMCYFRKKRQGKALQRAIDEIEMGGVPDKRIGVESKEICVLESRVEILVEESGGEDGWDADMEDEEEDEDDDDVERGRVRNGMSLPRGVR